MRILREKSTIEFLPDNDAETAMPSMVCAAGKDCFSPKS